MEIPVGTTEITQIQEYPLVLQKLIRFRSTHRYFRTYLYTEILCILYLVLVLQSISLSYGSYMELILIQKYP